MRWPTGAALRLRPEEDLPRGELQHEDPRGRVLDDRAGNVLPAMSNGLMDIEEDSLDTSVVQEVLDKAMPELEFLSGLCRRAT